MAIMRRNSNRALLCGSIVAVSFAWGANAWAQVRKFDIPAEGAVKAIPDFARQAGIQIIAPARKLRNVRTKSLKGTMDLRTALARLLAGTGLSVASEDGKTIILRATPGQDRGNRNLTVRASPLAAPSAAPTAPSAAPTVPSLQTIVVTATPMASGVKLLNASFSVTIANLHEIHDALPSSSADLLKIVPGLWPESSGGDTGANIELAGFPGGSDSPYVTMQINGSPIYASPTLSFMDNSSLIRLDDTVQRIEVVQGGPSVVYSSGQIGATVNFILRHGTATPHGELGLTLGSEGLYRLDGYYGGPLAPHWYFSIGGFYRESSGIRRSQFPANLGGQLTATLYHTWKNGTLLLWARSLNDKNLFITDIPVAVSPNGQNVSSAPGFNANTGTFAGNATRAITVEEFPCSTPAPNCQPGTISADLANGRGANIHVFGADLTLHVGASQLSDNLGYTGGTVPTNALFGNLPPTTLGTFIATQISTANTDSNIMSATGGSPFTTASSTWVNGGGAVSSNAEVTSLGFWIVTKKIQSFTNDLRLSRKLFHGNTLTVGNYFSSYSSNDSWFLGNSELMTATPNAQLINVTLSTAAGCPTAATPGGVCTGYVTQNGILSGSFYSLLDRYTGRDIAGYLSDQWYLGPWLFDAEYRLENHVIDGILDGLRNENLDGNWLTFYNNDVSVRTGQWTPSNYDHTLGAWSVGVNYDFSRHMSAYVRVNDGYHFPSFDDLRSGTPDTQQIKNFEVGVKAQTADFFTALTLFHRQFFGVPFGAFLANGSLVTATYGANSTGLLWSVDWVPINHLKLRLIGDWQDSKYTHYCTQYSASGQCTASNNGSYLQRQPRLQFRFTPQYSVPESWGALTVFSTYSYIDQRFSDPGNQQILPAYYTLDAGIIADIGTHFELRLQGTNLTDQIGLTEGNGRVLTSGISNGLEMARPIFGRAVQAQVKYLF